jgi:hypothetical protein
MALCSLPLDLPRKKRSLDETGLDDPARPPRKKKACETVVSGEGSDGEQEIRGDGSKSDPIQRPQFTIGNIDNLKQPTLNSPGFIDNDSSKDKLPIKERKRLFYHTHWSLQQSRLQTVFNRYLHGVQSPKSRSECWFYTSQFLDTTRRVVSAGITFRHTGKSERIVVNVALLGRLLSGLVTDEQKDGIIEYAWHTSHLCGNWTCLNPHHITIEPGRINIGRNSCFADLSGECFHTPKCMKALKMDCNSLLLNPDVGLEKGRDSRSTQPLAESSKSPPPEHKAPSEYLS